MTNEEMEKRWPDCPPFDAKYIYVFGSDGKMTKFWIDQDRISEVIAYFKEVQEAMNG